MPSRFRCSPCLVLCALLAFTGCAPLGAASPSAHRALVIGIDRYLDPSARSEIAEARRLTDLEGAVRDAETVAEVLESRGYDVRLLLDGEATRLGILSALEEHLVKPVLRGDDLVFFFAGHGSRLDTGDPEEPEGRDETLVPADAGRGAADLRDDELRAHLHRLLERGARLTVVLDACHSGSAVRGQPGNRSRAAGPAKVRPRALLGGEVPSLEQGNALILAAAQDWQLAGEVADEAGEVRGIFTHALLRALGAAGPWASAREVFRRTASLIAAEARAQRPVLAGSQNLKAQPLFAPGSRAVGRRAAGTTAAVVLADREGLIVMEGGWAQGLREGDVLVAGPTEVRLERVDPVRSRGRRLVGSALEPSTVLQRGRRGPLGGADLRVSLAEAPLTAEQLLDFDRRIAAIAEELDAAQVVDPRHGAPTHVLRFDAGWKIFSWRAAATPLGMRPREDEVKRALGRLPPDSRLAVQLPLPRGAAANVELGAGTRFNAIDKLVGSRSAGASPHYYLVGRRNGDSLVYAWRRMDAVAGETRDSPMPPGTRDVPWQGPEATGDELVSLARELARLRFWLRLETPEKDAFGYSLALVRDGETLRPDVTAPPPRVGVGTRYGFALWTEKPGPVAPRYVYVVLLDAHGRQQLFFPRAVHGSVENHFPLEGQMEQELVEFGPQPAIRIAEPAGLDTYILLTTSEPIPDPKVLDRAGVRAPNEGDHPLTRLILESYRGRRSDADFPEDWSISRLTVKVESPQ